MSLPIIDGSSKALVGKLGVFVGMDYVGKIEFTFNKTIPAGKIPAFGTEYSRTTYNELWEEVQKHPEWKLTEEAWQEFSKNNNGQVPYYSDGDGSTTFRVPCLTGFFEGAKSLEEVGTVKKAGLPNITGDVKNTDTTGAFLGSGKLVGSGAFTTDQVSKSVTLGSSNTASNIYFDASRSNPIYGKSDTVQPPSIVGMWVITAFVAVTNIGSTTLDNIASGVTELETRVGKIETTDTEMTDYVVERGGDDIQWYEVWKSGKLVQGGRQTGAGSGDGWYAVNLLKPYANDKYTVLRTIWYKNRTQNYQSDAVVSEVTTTYFKGLASLNGTDDMGAFWMTIGKGA